MIKSCIKHKSHARLNVAIVLDKLKVREEEKNRQEVQEIERERSVKGQRSRSSSRSCSPKRLLFKNSTKPTGQVLDSNSKSVPYIYMPKYEREALILPDRMRAKGQSAKRFVIKMKDSSSFLFRSPEHSRVREAIHSSKKQATICSRKYEQYTRIIDENQGVNKAKISSQRTSRHHYFHHSHNHDFFTQCEPMLEPKQDENRLVRKVTLAKTYNFHHSWRPSTRAQTSPTFQGRSNIRQARTTLLR